jgi:hypothetical protein
MTLEINFPDKILAGVHQSYTILSDAGAPAGKVLLAGAELEHRVIPLGPPKTFTGEGPPQMKYKVSFLIPAEAAGKTLTLRFEAGTSRVEETKEITAE